MIGSTAEDLEGVLAAMGYRRTEGEGGVVTWQRGRPPRRGERRRGKRESSSAKPHADSPFAKLKQIEFIR
jgi:ATP-dependent RNA helicase SUPV3L1/SUV3